MRSGRSIIHSTAVSDDGTIKFLLQLYDGRLVETVGIPADRDGGSRLTVCVSSQVRAQPTLRAGVSVAVATP